MSGWAAVLTQVPASDMKLPHAERDHQPLAFLSGCFRGASCNWSVIEKEAFALIRALTTTDYFCQTENGVVIYTDHRNLVYLFDPLGAEPGMHRHTAAKLLRWGARLSAFNYVIEHISSKDNCWEDLLTRWGASSPNELSVMLLLASGIIDNPSFDTFPRAEDIDRAQTADVERKSAIPQGLTISNGLYRRGEIVWIPADRELVIRLLVVAHAGRGGHRGFEATKAILKERFYWHDLDGYVRTFVREGLHCQRSTHPKESRLLYSQIHGTRLNQVIHFDFRYLGLTESIAYAFIIKEDISGYIWLIPCKKPTAEVVVDALTNWFSTFGVAKVWVSDQGSHFRNQVVDRLRQTLRVKHRFTQPYCAWSNGIVERVCREVLRLLRALYSEEPGRSLNDWPKLVKLCQLILNGTHRVSLGTTPMQAFIGLKDLPMDAVFSGSCEIDSVPLDQIRTRQKEFIGAAMEALADLHTKSIEKRTLERAVRVKAHNEKTNVIDPQLAVGDFVLVAADIKGTHA
jgi:transposase InsO family protein